jgi:hypothetical protein
MTFEITSTSSPAWKPAPLHPAALADRRFARKAREALTDWAFRSGCQWAITLNPNRSLSLKTELNSIRKAFREADELLLGHRYRRKDGRRRHLGFIFAEHIDSNLHFHLIVRPGLDCDPSAGAARCNLLVDRWARRVPSGTSMVKDAADPCGWSRYITKEIYRPDFEFWTSSMWWPQRQRRHVLESSWEDPFCAARMIQ